MKKSTRLIVAALVLFLGISASATAKEKTEKEWMFHDNACGAKAMGWNSSVNGVYGLNYQRWFENNIGLETTFGGSFNPDRKWDNYLCVNGQLQYRIFQSQTDKPFVGQFYFWGMGGYILSHQVSTRYVIEEDKYEEEERIVSNACAGLGFGAEVVFWERISIPVEFGMCGDFPSSPNVGFSVSTGIRFRF
ncbi:MAG: hypothetical protein KIG91_08405 [Treponema sp.]|nr:hypothetical protein [Treponema sp.]